MITSITALGIFTKIFWFFCRYLPARLFRIFTFKLEKSGKWSEIAQLAEGVAAFAQLRVFTLINTLLQQMKARVISEFYYKFMFLRSLILFGEGCGLQIKLES